MEGTPDEVIGHHGVRKGYLGDRSPFDGGLPAAAK